MIVDKLSKLVYLKILYNIIVIKTYTRVVPSYNITYKISDRDEIFERTNKYSIKKRSRDKE